MRAGFGGLRGDWGGGHWIKGPPVPQRMINEALKVWGHTPPLDIGNMMDSTGTESTAGGEKWRKRRRRKCGMRDLWPEKMV